MRARIRPALTYVPLVVAGLYTGRLLSEWRPGGWPWAMGLTLAAILAWLALGVLAQRWPFGRRAARHPAGSAPRPFWPASALLLYVLYPEPDPAIAGLALVLTLTLWGLLAAGWLRWPAGRWWAPAGYGLLALAALLLYTLTLAPDLLPADNGEFQLVAATLGVAHPPGFALYTLLAHLMTRLPLGPTAAYRANLFAALSSTATLLLVYATVYRLTRRHPAGLLATAALATATTFWAQATTANIRSLTAFFAALAIYALVHLRDNKPQPTTDPLPATPSTPQFPRLLFILALSFGITHHASLAFMGLIFGIYFLLLDGGSLRQRRNWWPMLLAGLAGLLPLLYFPLRAYSGAPGATPALATLSGFLDHVLARGFRGDFFYFVTPDILWERLKIMAGVLAFQFTPLLLAGMLLGLLRLLRRDWRLALLLGGSFAIHTLVTATYRAPQTVEYMLPAYVPAVIALGYGLAGLLPARRANLPRPGSFGPLLQSLGLLLAAGLLVSAFNQGVRHYPSYASLHYDTTARDYADTLLETAPTGSTILADWHWVTPLWYRQMVEEARPDITSQFVYPAGDAYAVTWAGRIAAEYATGRDVIATHFDADAYASLPPPEPLGDAFWFRQTPRTNLPAGFTPTSLPLGDGPQGELQILGYRLDPPTMPIGQEAVLTLAWQPAAASGPPLTLFAHLLGYDGAIYAQADVAAPPQPAGLTLTQLRLTPRPGAAPGDFAVAVGAYLTAEGTPLLNPAGEPRASLATLTGQPLPAPPFTQQPAFRTVVSGRPLLRLVGYDWDQTLPGRERLYLHWQTESGYQTEVHDVSGGAHPLPAWYGPWGLLVTQGRLVAPAGQHYVPLGQGLVWTGHTTLNGQPPLQPGQPLTLVQQFAATRPVLRDLVVSVRLVGYEPDSRLWAWSDLHDSIPALGAIPTLKWIGGSQVRDPHFLTVGSNVYDDQPVTGIVRLYDAFTSRPVPILDETITANYLGIPLGVALMDSAPPCATPPCP